MSKKVVFGTHLRDGCPTSSLESRFKFLIRVAQGSKLPDCSVLILEQPVKKNTLRERKSDKSDWEKAARELEGLTLVYDLGYLCGEPATLAWNKLHRHAFECLQADVFVYTDPNRPKWDESYGKAIEEKLAELAVQAQSMDYVIGDYTPVADRNSRHPTRNQRDVEFKIAIEAGVKQMLNERFPSILGGWPLFESMRRPRSEFHALSRRLYSKLRNLPPIPYDFGLQMLLVAAVEGMNIGCEDLGIVPVIDDERYSPLSEMKQLQRVDFQLACIQGWLSGLQCQERKEYQFPYQNSIFERVFATHNDLTSLLGMMRADYYDNERDDCVIWLTGRAWSKEPVLRIDHRFFLESDDIGIGVSIHPEDSIKAAAPAYHPFQTETIMVVDGDIVLECFTGEGEVAVKRFPKGSSVAISPRECHRVARDPEQEKAYAFVKTDLGMEPEKVVCDNCQIGDSESCPLRHRWVSERSALERRGYKTEGHQPRHEG